MIPGHFSNLSTIPTLDWPSASSQDVTFIKLKVSLAAFPALKQNFIHLHLKKNTGTHFLEVKYLCLLDNKYVLRLIGKQCKDPDSPPNHI